MTRIRRITRDQWVSSAMNLSLDRGVVPTEVSLNDLCERIGVTKGSFYSHFPGGLRDLHREIAGRWARDNASAELDSAVQAVRDPLDRLRALRARALQTARRDGTMRRWGSRDPIAAAAVADADRAVVGPVRAALADLGFPEGEASVLADGLVYAFAGAYHATAGPPPASDSADFETLLSILRRAAAGPRQRSDAEEAAAAEGHASHQVIVLAIGQDLPEADREDLRRAALEFAREHSAAPGSPAGQGTGQPGTEARRGTGA
jgi:AcrR family transcriptional regulator